MANRRMFSNRIARSAKFLQMPLEAQALYFHLILNADDDGVVETYPITRTLGTASDIIKILLTKEFIMRLNEDQVMLINDWQEHNSIRSDRKVDSIYKHLIPENVDLLEAKPRTDVKDNSKRIGGQSTDGISKVRLGKVKLSKDKLEVASAPTPKELSISFFKGGKHYEDMLSTFGGQIPDEVLKKEMQKFVLYWTEPNNSGKKQRWEMQKTFDVKRRLFTWLSKVKDFNSSKFNQKQGTYDLTKK